MTHKEARDKLGVTPYRLDIYLRNGDITARKVKRRWDICEMSVDGLIKEQEGAVTRATNAIVKMYTQGTDLAYIRDCIEGHFADCGLKFKYNHWRVLELVEKTIKEKRGG